MTHDDDSRALDVAAFAKAQARLTGQDDLSAFQRLCPDLAVVAPDVQQTVRWVAQGRTLAALVGAQEIWLDLQIDTAVPQICQRCLQPALSVLHIERSFRFVQDERTAAELDEESEHDVLVLSRRFDLYGLMEDEILMALPLVPRHEVCPVDVQWQAEDAGFQQAEKAAVRNPFSALDQLKKKS
jgi:uncharacterized protein